MTFLCDILQSTPPWIRPQ